MNSSGKHLQLWEARKKRSVERDWNRKAGSMRHQHKMKIQRRRRRKLFWLFAALAVGALLFEEQVAVLYVLSTLAICGLMIVVAFSNLEARDAEMKTGAIRETADDMSTNSGILSSDKRRAA